ncbi:MAG TPA: helix-turn-helix domain-containing protein [Thiotrichaceae bacterium]|nr:helix-turn-helix domain-containing protein [Thiotrichaceae bacterium]
MDKSIREVIFETAKGLNNAGLMDAETMRKLDTLCLPVLKEYSPEQIKQLRIQNNASQTVFAAYLNASPSTIQKWEKGQISPKGPLLKLLNLVEKKGIEILMY